MKMKPGKILFSLTGITVCICFTTSCTDTVSSPAGDCWQYRRMEMHIKTNDNNTFSTAPMLPPGSFVCLYQDGMVWEYTIGYETGDSMVLYWRMPDDMLVADYMAK